MKQSIRSLWENIWELYQYPQSKYSRRGSNPRSPVYKSDALANFATGTYGASNRSWTDDLRITSATLYQLSYRGEKVKATPDGIWTHDLGIISASLYLLSYRSNLETRSFSEQF